MTLEGMPQHVMGLRVAGLELWLDAQGPGLRLEAPPAHRRFLQPETSAACDLILRVRDGLLPEGELQRTPLCLSEIWELWRDESGGYVFVAPRGKPPRWVVVDADFTEGEVFGQFASSEGEPLYPLKSLDIRLYANWLAAYGDVILHASGVALDGRGYAFAGAAGVGKSTLAASLMTAPESEAEDAPDVGSGATVLGEDQVILRFLDKQFWIYGTPWHEDPAMCAPLGVRLEKLFFLDRGAPTGVQPLRPIDGVTRLLQTALIPYYRPAAMSAILDRLARLAREVPFYTLSYELGTDVTELVRDA